MTDNPISLLVQIRMLLGLSDAEEVVNAVRQLRIDLTKCQAAVTIAKATHFTRVDIDRAIARATETRPLREASDWTKAFEAGLRGEG